MIFTQTTPNKKNKLIGAVHINDSSYFVCRNQDGKICIKNKCEENIKEMVNSNPTISRLLKNYKIKLKINKQTLKELSTGHMNETCKVAIGIHAFLPENLRKKVEKTTLKEACILHDLGKTLIPLKVLNKPAKLNVRERKIMNIHSRLGYELLKTQEIKEDTLTLVKYHHQNLKHSGYPIIISNNNISDIGVQIISVADKYSALREARVYRKELSRIKSLLIIYQEVLEGKILKEVFNSLVQYATLYDNTNDSKPNIA